MNCLLVLVAGLILSAPLGNCLRCYYCPASTNRCVTESVTCPGKDEQCFFGKATVAGVTVYNAGCIPPAVCGQQHETGEVSVAIHCCNTDLCNASDQVKLSLVLFPALVSVWFAIFM
ncbi:prostate stem cell antigen-like [Rhinoraja longicauda]